MEGELQMVLNRFKILRDFDGRVRQEARGDHHGEVKRCYFMDTLQRGGFETLPKWRPHLLQRKRRFF